MSEPKKRKSKFDEFFHFIYDGEEKIGECRLCTTEPKRVRMKNKNTTGLKKHLQSHHKIAYHSIFAEDEKGKPDIYMPDNINDALVDWVAQKYFPLNTFDDDYSQKLFKRLNPEVNYPRRNSMKDQVLQRYEDLKSALKEILYKNTSKFSYTIDGWTSVGNKCMYGITIHFIDNEWCLRSLILDFVRSNGGHSGKDIADIFSNSLKEFKTENKTQGITVDNVSANTTFMEELEEILPFFDKEDQHFRCIAHILNLGVQDMLKSLDLSIEVETEEVVDVVMEGEEIIDVVDQNKEGEVDDDEPDITNAITKIRSLFKKVRKSEQLEIKLKNACGIANIPYKKPILDVKTRWNSTFEMISIALSSKDGLKVLCNSVATLSILQITDLEWDILKKLTYILEDFKNVSELLGGENYVTIPMVIGYFNLLIDKLENLIQKLEKKKKNERSLLDQKMLAAYQAAVTKMLKHYSKTNWVYCVCLLLDPRFRAEGFMSTSWGRDLYKTSFEKFKDICRSYSRNETNENNEVTMDHDRGENSTEGEEEDDEKPIDFSVLYVKSQEKEDWEKEMEIYFSEPRCGQDQDILRWWKMNQDRFPLLAKIARDLLSITATSVPAERLFSKAGLFIRKLRNRLASETARSLLCINSWCQKIPQILFCLNKA